ncbi:MAG: hypothetical protein E6575_12110 [Bradyrhizobium sp.]|jgi:hypothetical protein|nr:hypothetical protein [Bradyrhizobium sp.]
MAGHANAAKESEMASWLELLFNIIGYGGFVVIASCHPGGEPAGTENAIDDITRPINR